MGVLLVTVETNVPRVCPPVQEVSTQKYSMFFQEDTSFCHYDDFKFPSTMQEAKDRLWSASSPAEDTAGPLLLLKVSSQDSKEPLSGPEVCLPSDSWTALLQCWPLILSGHGASWLLFSQNF